MNAVFDTHIVIDALNGLAQANVEYDRYERVFISRITWMEILIGATGDDAELRDFLESHFEIVPIDVAVSESAVQLRRKYRMKLPDAIIWATAKQPDLSWSHATPKISTPNGKEYVCRIKFSWARPRPALSSPRGATGAKVSELRYRGASLWDKACPLRFTSGVLREGEIRCKPCGKIHYS